MKTQEELNADLINQQKKINQLTNQVEGLKEDNKQLLRQVAQLTEENKGLQETLESTVPRASVHSTDNDQKDATEDAGDSLEHVVEELVCTCGELTDRITTLKERVDDHQETIQLMNKELAQVHALLVPSHTETAIWNPKEPEDSSETNNQESTFDTDTTIHQVHKKLLTGVVDLVSRTYQGDTDARYKLLTQVDTYKPTLAAPQYLNWFHLGLAFIHHVELYHKIKPEDSATLEYIRVLSRTANLGDVDSAHVLVFLGCTINKSKRKLNEYSIHNSCWVNEITEDIIQGMIETWGEINTPKKASKFNLKIVAALAIDTKELAQEFLTQECKKHGIKARNEESWFTVIDRICEQRPTTIHSWVKLQENCA